MQQSQQIILPINMGLKLQPIPVIKVGNPYSIKNNGVMYSPKLKAGLCPVTLTYSFYIGI